eukprot:CAMPEP_0198290442 /NCGR_PEP_ID=MMETSP1449-20131203/8311_1 /TAXON_ID=420275 /ORGANISM="Attheya septentrionalis, Strain CCMP2084" /LENGTH=636 /DNA_ID=CAMNT_0043988947 /DNA_START=163 /DNA_END=2073 /DNA_ORIENTATION=+
MLISLVQGENELMALCRAGSWETAKVRCVSHPQEATPSKGHSCTALVMALRHGAPLHLIISLVIADPSQLEIVDSKTGTALHEALMPEHYHKSSTATAKYLIQYVRRHGITGKKYSGRRSSLFMEVDYRNRTPLHGFLCRSLCIQMKSLPIKSILELTKMLVQAFPLAMYAPDDMGFVSIKTIIGATPRCKSMDMEFELMILELLRIFFAEDPRASLGIQYNEPVPQNRLQSTFWSVFRPVKNYWKRSKMLSRWLPGDIEDTIQFMTKHSHISDAIISKRSEMTVHLLLETIQGCLKESEINPCAKFSSSPNVKDDLPLIWCILTSSSIHVLKLILDCYPAAAVHQRNSNGGTPLFLAWQTYILHGMGSSWPSVMDAAVDAVRTSGRFSNLQTPSREEIVRHFQNGDNRVANFWLPTKGNQSLRTYTTPALDLLWEQAKLLLPASASTIYSRLYPKDNNTNNVGEWPTLHAACFIYTEFPQGCPVSMLILVLYHCSHQLKQFDARGNLPAHYIAASTRHNPMPIPRCPPLTTIFEAYPDAASAFDCKGQLPLHIATQNMCINFTSIDATEHREAVPPVCRILSCFPEALEIPNPSTGLYPFMEAAAKPIQQKGEAREIVDIVYRLLRENPTICKVL